MRDSFAGQGSSLDFHNVLAPLSLNTAYNRDVNLQRSQQTPSKVASRASSTLLRTRSNPESPYSNLTKQRRYSSSPLKNKSRIRAGTSTRLLYGRTGDASIHYVETSSASFQIIRRHTGKTSRMDCAKRSENCFPLDFASCSSPCASRLFGKTRTRSSFHDETFFKESDQSKPRQTSPSSRLSRSSSLASQSSACTITSPLTSVCNRIDDQSQDCPLPTSTDWTRSDMPSVQNRDTAPNSSPLAYKRKEPSTSINDHNAKRRKCGSESGYPEVVLSPSNVSPWTKGWTPGTLQPSYLLLDSDQEEEDYEDDEITLLPTKKSIADYTSSLASSSPVQRSSPFAGSNTPRKSSIDKLTSLMDDVFEAETDVQSSDGVSSTISSHARAFFIVQDGTYMLSNDTISKLMCYIRACPASRSIPQGNSSPIKQRRQQWSDMDAQELSRLIKVMHRGLEQTVGLDPFPQVNKERKRSLPVKKSNGRRKSSTPADKDQQEKDDALLCGATLDQMMTRLGRIAHALMIADNCLTILYKEGTSKLLLCEEMILPCLHFIKTALDNVVVPFAEACSGVNSCSNALVQELVIAVGSMQASPAAKSTHHNQVKNCKNQLATIFGHLLSSLYRLESLLKKPELILSETMSFILANSLLPPFFILDTDTTASSACEQLVKSAALESLCAGQSPMKTLRLSAIHIIRLTYERSKEQKEYIVTTILDSMQFISDTRKQGRKQFGLPNGKAICSSTALLLQIIQASSMPIAKAIKLDTIEWEEDNEEEEETRSDNTAADSDVYKIDVLREGQDMARRAAGAMAECLMQKIINEGIAKGAKGSIQSEAKFATVMDSLVTDLLDTLPCPEWPASSLLLSQLSVQFCNYLDEEKGNHEVRNIALYQLGVIAMRLCESKLRCQSIVGGMIDICAIRDSKDSRLIDELNDAYWTVVDYLKQKTDEDGSMDSAARFLEAQWGREMILFLYRCVDMVTDLTEANDEENLLLAQPFVRHVDTIIGRMVKKANSIDTNSTQEEESVNTMALSVMDTYERLLHSFAFGTHFEAIESKLLAASNGPHATNRNKALRGLSQISEVNGDFLLQIEVRAAVQRCMYDESVHVRDTAVALLGKFFLSHPEQLELLLPSFTEKMQDTGLLVRKRTLRLLRDVYDKSKEQKIQVAAAVQIVQSVFDEEETVRDLAVESVAQMWFAMSSNIVSKSPSKPRVVKTVSKQDDEERDEQDWDVTEREELQRRLDNIVFVADKLRVKPSPVQEVLRQIVKKCDEDKLQKQMGQLVNLTIDNIVQLQQENQESVAAKDVVKQVEVISLLVQTNPLTLSIRKAKLLLPYMRGGSKEAEIRLLGRLLAIFNSCLPTMSGTASSFAKQLQSTLTPLVSKPSHHFSVIEELIKCYCTVIRSQTHDFTILIRTMQICHRQVKNIQMTTSLQEEDVRKAKVFIVTTSLLTENADYDGIRTNYSDHAQDIDQITPHCISEEVAAILTKLLDVAPLKVCALQSLRFVCRAFPKLLMSDFLGSLMESILKEGNNNDRFIVLRTVANILEMDMTKFDPEQGVHGREKKKEARRKVAREELAGESEAMGNSITFAIVSRYGNLVQTLAVQIPLQRLVLEIVEAIVMRGICHPLQYLSIIIALQTVTDDKWVNTKAQNLHRHLLNRNSTSINFRYTIHAREAWQFQKSRIGLEVNGCTATCEALFETWYETIREQRKTRMEFLKALVKSFDVDISKGECSQDDVHYARFLAENLATLPYKTEEEVVLIASELQSIMATSGEQVQISVQEEIPVDGEEEKDEEEMEDEMDEAERQRAITIGRMSTIMSIALRLLAHLCQQYGLSEGRIAKGMDKKASNAAATRKGSIRPLALVDLPGAWKREEGLALAKREMNTFDHLLNSEGYGAADADDYDMND